MPDFGVSEARSLDDTIAGQEIYRYKTLAKKGGPCLSYGFIGSSLPSKRFEDFAFASDLSIAAVVSRHP